MPSLLDPPSEEALTLFRTVLYARAATDGGWPVWQYVVLKLDAEGLDAYDVLRGLPTWGYNYRPCGSREPARGAPLRWSMKYS